MNLENKFAWSTSRAACMTVCRRRYYWQYYGSFGGWEVPTPKDSAAQKKRRLAYSLKNTHTLHSMFGEYLHDTIKETIPLMPNEVPLDSLGEHLYESVKAKLHKGCLAGKDIRTWRISPKENPALLEIYYLGSFKDEVAVLSVDNTREKLEALKNAAVLTTFQEIATGRVKKILELDEDIFRGEYGKANIQDYPFPIYAKPDLVYLRDDGKTVITDWKTSFTQDDTRHRNQLKVYAYYVNQRYGTPYDNLVCRIENTSKNITTEFDVTENDIANIIKGASRSIEKMRTLVVDGDLDRNEPLNINQFKQDETKCLNCKYAELCEKRFPAEK